jgi:membrane protein YqaA with SNARE-associated domain
MEQPTPVTQDDRNAAQAPVIVSRWAIHRRLYDWVLAFAHHPHSQTALFLISFAESSFFPIPPDVLLAPLCLGMRKRSLRFATITTVGSVLGAYLGYAIGFALLPVGQWIVGADNIRWLAGEFDKRGDVWVFVAALTPVPFKLLTITAGVAKMNLLVFTIACFLGRAARFYAVALLFWWAGPRAVPLIDRYFNWLCLAFVVLGVLGFVALKFMR